MSGTGRRRIRFDIRRAGKPIVGVLAVWLVLCAAFFFLFVRPKAREYAYLQETRGPEIEALKRRTREVEEREAFHQALQKAESDLVLLREDLLSTRQRRMVEVQAELDRLCAQFQIDLEQVNFNDDILEDERFDRDVMIVPLEGGYAALRRFLQAVESSEQFIVVEQVALGSGKEGGVMLQLDVTLATYYDLSPEEKRRLEEQQREQRRRARRARRA